MDSSSASPARVPSVTPLKGTFAVLAGFLSGYLHPDWDHEWSHPTDAASFTEMDDLGSVDGAIGEIRNLLARTLSEDDRSDDDLRQRSMRWAATSAGVVLASVPLPGCDVFRRR